MLGPPASGKGTQGKRLAAHLGIPHVSTGALLRRTIEQGDPHGVAPLVAEGRRVPDEVVEAVLAPALGDAFLLDGYPRTARQAERLDQLLGGRRLDRAVELTLDEATLCARMFLRAEYEHRGDDSPEVFLRRLEDYQREAPAIRRHYGGPPRGRGLLGRRGRGVRTDAPGAGPRRRTGLSGRRARGSVRGGRRRRADQVGRGPQRRAGGEAAVAFGELGQRGVARTPTGPPPGRRPTAPAGRTPRPASRCGPRGSGRTSGTSGPRSRRPRRPRGSPTGRGPGGTRRPAPRKLSTSPALCSAPSCCSRNRSGMR